jgi:hypothetical protein
MGGGTGTTKKNSININGLEKRASDMTKHYLRNTSIIGGFLILFSYFIAGISTGAWTPKQIKEYSKKAEIEQAERIQYRNRIDSSYNQLFENCASFQDSVDIYKKYGLPIKLRYPSFEDKENAVKQKLLENIK